MIEDEIIREEYIVGERIVDKKCPNCGIGIMEFDGMTYATFDPTYLHKCNKCDNFFEEYKDRYPKTVKCKYRLDSLAWSGDE